jgi:hypothetical protein
VTDYLRQYENDRQRQAYLALGRLLTRAAKAGLPPIEWRVSSGVNVALIGVIEDSWLRREKILSYYEQWCTFFDGHLTHEDDIDYDVVPSITKHARVKDVPWLGHELLLRAEVPRR